MRGEGDVQSPSFQARALSLALHVWVRPMVGMWSRTSRLPWPYWTVDHFGRLNRPVRGTRFTAVRLPNCRAQWIDARADEADGGRVILYLPGGGFLVGGWHLHRAFLSRLSRRTGARILAVDYRKLPHNLFTHAAEDVLDAYRHLIREGIAAEDIVIAGDSAGGFLTLQAADHIRQAGLPRPSAIIAISPLLSLVDFDRRGRGCAVMSPRAIRILARFGHVVDDTGPMRLVNSDMPPVLIHAASRETLAGQVRTYEQLLIKFGVPHEVRLWPLDVHVFHAAHWLPEAGQALDSIAEFLDDVESMSAKPMAA